MPFIRSLCLIIVLILCQGRYCWAQEDATKTDDTAKIMEELDFANGLFGRGLYDLALQEYTKFTEAHKDSEYLYEAYFGIAESMFFKEDYAKALAAYQDFLSRFAASDNATIAHLRLGQIYFVQNNFQEALNELGKVNVDKLPKEELKQSYHFYMGRNLAGLEQYDKALPELQKAVAFDKNFPHTAQGDLILGDIYVKLAQPSEALAAYQKAAEISTDEQIKIWATFKTGEAKFAAGAYEEAINIFNQFIAAYPTHQLSREATIDLMSAYFNVGNFDAVQSTFNTTFGIDNKPLDFQALYILTNAFLRQFQIAKAQSTIDQALALPNLSDKDKVSGLAKKTEILIKLKDYQQALNIIQDQLAKLGAGNDEILFFEAESYYGLNQYQAALSTYEKIIKEYPDSKFQDEATWGRALTLKALGELDQAMALMTQFYDTAKEPTLKENALYNAFLINVQQEKTEEALALSKTYRDNYATGAHYEKVLYLTGNLYTNAGKYDEAIQTYQQYLKDFPQTDRLSEIQFLLAFNQQTAGKPQEAIQTYNSIVPVGKDNKFVYSALKNTAGIYIEQGDAQNAFVILKRIQDEFEEDDLGASTFIWVAQKFVDEKKYNEALEVLDRIPLDKASDKEKSALAYFKAESFQGIQDHQKAIELYDAAIASGQDNEYVKAAQVGKAEVLKDMQRFDEAGAQLESLVENNPQDHTISLHARYNLGELEELQGNLEAAVKYYLLVAVLYDDETLVPQALFKAGEILEKQNKMNEALKTYDELITRYQKNELAQKANERIQALKTR